MTNGNEFKRINIPKWKIKLRLLTTLWFYKIVYLIQEKMLFKSWQTCPRQQPFETFYTNILRSASLLFKSNSITHWYNCLWSIAKWVYIEIVNYYSVQCVCMRRVALLIYNIDINCLWP